MLSLVGHGLRYALRNLSRSMGFTAVAVLALGIGIGLNTALFTVVKAVLLEPLPFPDAQRLVAIHESIPTYDMRSQPSSTIEYSLIGQIAKSYEALGAYQSITGEFSGGSLAETATGARVTASLFDVLGIHPLIGRAFRADEDFEGSSVIVLSYKLWSRRFARDPAIVGKTVTLDRQPRTILGVMPPSFVFPLRGPTDNSEPADFYVPMAFTAMERVGRGPILEKSVIGKLKSGVNIATARAELPTLVPAVTSQFPSAYLQGARDGIAFDLVPLQEEVTGRVGIVLWLLMAAVGVLLLIACANVANLTLARAASRRREFAVRAALGASRAALIRLTLCESLLVSVFSATTGMVLAASARRLFSTLSPIQIPRLEELRTDAGVVFFALAAAVFTTFCCGIAAALQNSRTSPHEALKDAARGSTAGRSSHRTMGLLVNTQFAFTVVLLIAGGLMLRTLVNTLRVDPGFRADHAVEVTTHLPATFYSRAAQIRGLYLQLANSAEQLPGVQAAGVGTELPLGDWSKGTIVGENSPTANVAASSGPIASQVWVTGHYLEALAVPVKRGRLFDDVEYSESRNVVVISESLAARLWPGEDPVGRRLRNSRTTWETVVGVVGDIHEVAMNAPKVPQIYEPHSQLPDRLIEAPTIPMFRTVHLVSRSREPEATQLRQLIDTIQRADSSLAVSDAGPLSGLVGKSNRSQWLNVLLLSGFGGTALLLAIMGVGSMLGYLVVQRRGEIGIRMALGAQPRDVLQLILAQGFRLAVVGVAVGIVAAGALTRLMSRFLFGVRAFDPLTFTIIPLLLVAVACVVSYLPAQRAAHVDPMVALREQ